MASYEDDDQDEIFLSDDERQPANDTETAENETGDKKEPERVPVPKRVIKNPRLKFNPDRLCGKRGIPVLVDHFKDVKFKGKGHETQDLNKLMSHLEHWCHRLFPSMRFEDCLKQIERLGKKRPVQTCLRKIRLDQPILNDDFISEEQDRDIDRVGEETSATDLDTTFDNLFASSSASTSRVTTHMIGTTPITLTEEQIRRMEQNKQLALERRKARMAAESAATISNTNSSKDVSNFVFDSLVGQSSSRGAEETLPLDKSNSEFIGNSSTISLQEKDNVGEINMEDTDDVTVLIPCENPADTTLEIPCEMPTDTTQMIPCENPDESTRVIPCEESEELEMDELMDLVDEEA